jgi:bifunctional non-homologous end joining protein LigD
VKFDGYRIQAHIVAGKVRLYTRTGLDWTSRFGSDVTRELGALAARQAIIDCEMVVLSPDGIASFSLLQSDLSEGRKDRLIFYAFDLLHLDSASWTSEPLEARKSQLEKLLARQPADSVVRYSEDFSQTGDVMLAHACRMGLEGVISKRIGAPYRSGRSMDWIKSKCIQRQEFIIVGYLPSSASGRGIQSVLVAYHEKGHLQYGGRVGTGFTAKSIDSLKKKLDQLKTAKPAIDGLDRKERKAIWVRPKLVAEIEFRAWTHSGILRQASYKGLREDKPAEEIVKENPVKTKDPKKNSSAIKPLAMRAVNKTAVELSNPGKLLWPSAGVSKQDLLDYYATVWPRMEKFIVDRPLSLLRAPDGIDGQLFFQKHASPGMHPAIGTLRASADKQEHLFIRNFDGLAALVQLGVVEVHIWGAKIDKIEQPDQIIFDLDPDEGLKVEAVRAAALELKEHLQDLDFQPLLKTSGGKGFHVVVPLKAKAEWEEVKAFAHDFSRAMVQAAPEKYTATLAKKARKGRIFIDYLRNGRGSTTVAPYSLRANTEAAISMPIEWSALQSGIDPKAYVIGSSETQKVLRKPNPWTNFFKGAKSLR